MQGGASPDPTRGTIVPASTRDVGLPSLAADGQVAAVSRPVAATPAQEENDPGVAGPNTRK